MNTDLTTWIAEGDGSIAATPDGSYEMRVGTPYTLWHPEPVDGPACFSFRCSVLTPNSAMLFFACARDWQGHAFFGDTRSGDYAEYNSGTLESYTVGFNRAAHVTNDDQPNASTANVRRLGGELSFGRFQPEQMRPNGELDLPVWREWNCHTNLASAREHASGLDRFFHYEFVFYRPYIRLFVEGEELLTVIDHRPNPLAGGYFGIRNMTPGAHCRLKDFTVTPADDSRI